LRVANTITGLENSASELLTSVGVIINNLFMGC